MRKFPLKILFSSYIARSEHQHVGVILLWGEVVASLHQTKVPEWKLESHVQT